MFLLRKLLTALIVPPGVFILLGLLVAALARKRWRLYCAILAAALYALSIDPVANLVLRPLEHRYPVPVPGEVAKADAIVVLGGGGSDHTRDIDGEGTLTADSLARVVGAFTLYAKTRKPVIITGGPVDHGAGRPEGAIAKKALLQLGVPPDHVMVEGAARTTAENALLAKQFCDGRKIRRIVLVTSAFHMPRSMLLFEPHFTDIVPYPVGFKSGDASLHPAAFVPDIGPFTGSCLAIKEYFGYLYYRVRYGVGGGGARGGQPQGTNRSGRTSPMVAFPSSTMSSRSTPTDTPA